MNNICIDVYVPGINKSYDIVVADDLTVKNAADYILKTIKEFEVLENSDVSAVLCSKRQKRILDESLTLAESEIKDGSELILV